MSIEGTEARKGAEVKGVKSKSKKTGIILVVIIVILILAALAVMILGEGDPASIFGGGDGAVKNPGKYITATESSWQIVDGGERQYVFEIVTTFGTDDWNAMATEDREKYALALAESEIEKTFEAPAEGETYPRYRLVGLNQEGLLIFMVADGNANTYNAEAVTVEPVPEIVFDEAQAPAAEENAEEAPAEGETAEEALPVEE